MAGVGIFVSWIPFHGRSADLADDLGLDCHFVASGSPGHPWSAPMRYVTQSWATVGLVRRTRPGLVVAMAPPLPLVLLLLLLQRVRHFTLVVDAHTGAVRSRSGGPRRVFRVVARFADRVLVASPTLEAELREAGVDVVVVHDPIPAREDTGDVADSPETVLFPATWAFDEPIEALVEAARSVPDVRVVVTGRVRPTRITGELPPNVELTGFLSRDEYERRFDTATAVLALTTREDTMQRAGYEALASAKPLVVSDTRALLGYFDDAAVPTAADAASLAAAISRCVAEAPALRERMRSLRGVRMAEHRAVVAELLRAVRSP
jgi:glycosyltransferase involved in cell wall biosynthesis